MADATRHRGDRRRTAYEQQAREPDDRAQFDEALTSHISIQIKHSTHTT